MSNEVSLNSIAAILNQPNTEIFYSFWGTPFVEVSGQRGNFNGDLNTLARRVYDFDGVQNRQSGMDYLLAGYLTGKVRHLYELADQTSARVNCITRIFIACRKWFSDLLACCEIFDTRQLFELSYLGFGAIRIPANLVRQDQFLSEATTSLEIAPGSTNIEYSPDRIVTIYENFLARA